MLIGMLDLATNTASIVACIGEIQVAKGVLADHAEEMPTRCIQGADRGNSSLAAHDYRQEEGNGWDFNKPKRNESK